MKLFNSVITVIILSFTIIITGCDKNDNVMEDFDITGTYMQKDQMARPGIATVFISADKKDQFNMTPPAAMGAAFRSEITNKLSAFGYMSNALGQTKEQFAELLATDVLNVRLIGETTFFDGTHILTGRALEDDVIDTELLLIFGGASGTSNPGLTSDNVNANDQAFLTTFPYLANPH